MRTASTLTIVTAAVVVATAAVAAGSQTGERTGDRIGGVDRFETAAQIARAAFPDGAETAYLARHDAFPDSLAATSLHDGPVLLTTPCGPIPPIVLETLDQLGVGHVVALGGDEAVADQTVEQAVRGERDDRLACPSAIPSSKQGLRLRAERHEDSVHVVLVNERDTSVESGRHFTLEKGDGAGFDPLDPPVGPFRDDAVLINPGDEVRIAEVGPTVVRDGEPTPIADGHYRVRYTVDGVELAATFAYPPGE